MVIDNLTLVGDLSIELNGTVIHKIHNLVVDAGKDWVAGRMANSGTVMTHMGVGTGSTAAAAADTALGSAISGGRIAVGTSGGTVSGSVISFTGTWGAGTGTGAITEAGIFDSSSGGTMLARTVFAVVNKAASDTITITWTITVS